MSDTHGSIDIGKLKRFRHEHKKLTKNDYVIVCGDFGLLWNYESLDRCIGSNTKDWCWAEDEIRLFEWYNDCPWTTLFIDGNHSNFDRLKTYPITEWHGGRIQKISDSIIHLMRGEIYEIDGRSIFTMGGAMSTDRGTATGTELYDIHKWWWPEEIPSSVEWNYAYDNLNKVNWKVDYIITHDAPATITMQTRLKYRVSKVSSNLEIIHTSTDFKHWFCGHLHMDEDFNNVSVLYNRVLPIEYSVY